MRGTGTGLGQIVSGGWLDVEAPLASPGCGRPERYLERIVTARGSLAARVWGARLCLGVTGSFRRTYRVIDATGALRRLHGAGTIELEVLDVGATESWSAPSGPAR